MQPVIEVKDLIHIYPSGVQALKGVDLAVQQGDILGIIGQNGSGKTTLVRHFNGLLKPTSGQVLLNGQDTAQLKVGDMSQQVGYVFQNPSHQIFRSTVRDELLVAPKNFHFTEQQKEENLERVVKLFHLDNILKVHPMTLDYTTKKLVTIASVVIFSPKVLILDEPTGGLDEPGRRLLSHVIELMKEQELTTIIISHDMDYVAENTRRIITMAQGTILKDADPYETFCDEEVLRQAWIEPPQIVQIDRALDRAGRSILNVSDFVHKYAQRGGAAT